MVSKLTSRPAKRPENKNQQCGHSKYDPDTNLAEAKEMLSVAAVAAENLEVLLAAVNKEMASYGPYNRHLIHMLELAWRLVAAQNDYLTSKRGGHR